jgi:hypothetical protein
MRYRFSVYSHPTLPVLSLSTILYSTIFGVTRRSVKERVPVPKGANHVKAFISWSHSPSHSHFNPFDQRIVATSFFRIASYRYESWRIIRLKQLSSIHDLECNVLSSSFQVSTNRWRSSLIIHCPLQSSLRDSNFRFVGSSAKQVAESSPPMTTTNMWKFTCLIRLLLSSQNNPHFTVSWFVVK